jgi:hypothetical protein
MVPAWANSELAELYRTNWNNESIPTTFDQDHVCRFLQAKSLTDFNQGLEATSVGYLPTHTCLSPSSGLPNYSNCFTERFKICAKTVYKAQSLISQVSYKIGSCNLLVSRDNEYFIYFRADCTNQIEAKKFMYSRFDDLKDIYSYLVENSFGIPVAQSKLQQKNLVAKAPPKKLKATRAPANDGGDCCVCLIDSEPEKHVHWYKKGCSLWYGYGKRNCSQLKKTIFVNEVDKLQSSIPNSCQKLELGYVGHWIDSDQTAYYIHDILYPLAVNKNISINFDNTACSAADKPEMLQNYLVKATFPEGVGISIKANQVDSVGMWLHFLPALENVHATVDSTKNKVSFMDCEDVENLPCSKGLAKEQKARCHYQDSNNALKTKNLACRRIDKKIYENGRAPKITHRYEWAVDENPLNGPSTVLNGS